MATAPDLLSRTGADARYAPIGATGSVPVYRMLNLAEKVRKIKDGEVGRVKWVTMFDSYAQKVIQQMAPYLFNAVGPVAGAYFSGATATRGITSSSTGTITDNLSDFSSWPSGLTSSFAASATRTFGQGGGSFIGDLVRVFWINDGGGTFKIQIDGVDASTPTVTTGGGLGSVTLTPTLGSHTVTIVGLTGTSKIVGVGYENTTASGMCFINIAQGGIAMNSPTTQAMTNLGTFLALVKPDVVSNEAKELASYLAAALDTFVTTIRAATPNTDIVLIQSPPQSTSDADNVAQNAIIAAKAAQYGCVAWDSYTPFKDWATLSAIGASSFTATTTNGSATLSAIAVGASRYPLIGSVLTGTGIPAGTTVLSVNTSANTLVMSANATASATGVAVTATGWGADGTHIHTDADFYRGVLMFRDLGIFTMTGVQPYDTQATHVLAYNDFKLGVTPTAPVLALLADTSSDFDAYANIKRILALRDASGTAFANFDSRNATGNPSDLPKYSRVGVGLAGFVGGSASLLYAAAWNGSNMNSPADLSVRTLIKAISSNAAATGTVTCDLTAGGIHRLTLTGNVTLKFTNAVANGQEVEVHFVQDATGSRTLLGTTGTGVTFAGQATPTLTTTPGARDIFKFRFIDGGYHEIGRSMNA